MICKGCGNTDTIVEISLVPRIVPVRRYEDGSLSYHGYGWPDDFMSEADAVIGYGCKRDDCEFWHGNWANEIGNRHDDKNGPTYDGWAPTLEEIAEEKS